MRKRTLINVILLYPVIQNIEKYAIVVYYWRMITIAETESFQKKVVKLLSVDEKSELISYLAENPNSGVLIQGTGGLRKLRWARSGGGKSGGVRVVYFYHSEVMPLYILAVFGKNEKANISAQEKKILAKLIKELVAYWRERK